MKSSTTDSTHRRISCSVGTASTAHSRSSITRHEIIAMKWPLNTAGSKSLSRRVRLEDVLERGERVLRADLVVVLTDVG